MDRNTGSYHPHFHVVLVALRKESVDRNGLCEGVFLLRKMSLSARRAWIEMCDVSLNYKEVLVALRKESVDRNKTQMGELLNQCKSLSARRAWIEMAVTSEVSDRVPLASLSARRAWIEIRRTSHDFPAPKCRSPQGERG